MDAGDKLYIVMAVLAFVVAAMYALVQIDDIDDKLDLLIESHTNAALYDSLFVGTNVNDAWLQAGPEGWRQRMDFLQERER